jgi:predicted alpha/beta-fold hydrolase
MAQRLDAQASSWLPGGHLQTVWPALTARSGLFAPAQRFERERWTTPDGDFVDVDWRRTGQQDSAVLVLFHGLEGSSRSHYAQAFAAYAQRQGLDFVVPHFRGCSGEMNRAARAYHSGDHEEVGWMLQTIRAQSARPVLAIGVSLGGNALLRWAQEAGAQASATVAALAAISAPVDLRASARTLDQGLNRQVYTRLFLRTMKRKALHTLNAHPGLLDGPLVRSAASFYDFDEQVTAPLHGFRGALDYWQRASAKPGLARIQVPTLLLNARNDPMVPAHSLPAAGQVGPWVQLCQPQRGGHVGFTGGWPPGSQQGLAQVVGDWLQKAQASDG